ncbi:FAD-dependent oxidoreductase [Natrarchaeobaculum aegyptiacum]|uniref:FAD dependent oxidoreductase domain-containing protein n=1 Tax=Natrarchaeobaculum aegyptiacum TaxID=745377 RepID=A0A2Z2HZQ6_9EURY|nr:FAD-dependent oxidoreductase [Natrarchaeobaculum aegyptiacum]ARS90614.1 hypothetical protein B1756_13350 [Natrarchaeobaculum aegyptiacum]
MTDRYDVVVVGVGGMGTATVAALADSGVDVLGLERRDVPPVTTASVTGRTAPFVADESVPGPLLEAALTRWDALEADHDRRLLWRTGAVAAGPDAESAIATDGDDSHEVDVEERYPAVDLPEAYEASSVPVGGVLDAGECLLASITRALGAGATIRARERVVDWRSTDDGVRVETDHGAYAADALVVTAGPWTAGLIDDLEDIVVPERYVFAQFHPSTPETFTPDQFPVFDIRADDDQYVLAPAHRVPGLVVGSPRPANRTGPRATDPVDRDPTQADERRLRDAVDRYVPDGLGPTLGLETRLASTTPDGHPVVDTLPDQPNVAVAAGFDRRTFVLASVVGDALADLAIDGETDYDLEQFSLARF